MGTSTGSSDLVGLDSSLLFTRKESLLGLDSLDGPGAGAKITFNVLSKLGRQTALNFSDWRSTKCR